MKKQIVPQGIVRNKSKLSSDDGLCDEIINLRPDAGEWKLMQQKKKLWETGTDYVNYSHWYNHPVTDDYILIARDLDDAVSGECIKEINLSTNDETVLLPIVDENVLKIYHFGYILIVITDMNRYYLKYDPDDLSYTLLPDIEHGVYDVQTYSADRKVLEFTSVDTFANPDDFYLVFPDVVKRVNDMRKDGYVNGHTFFRAAFVTEDGNYIMPTTSYYHYLGIHNWHGSDSSDLDNIPRMLLQSSEPGNIDSELQAVTKWAYFVKPKFSYRFNSEQIATLDKYTGIIKSLAIFMTKPFMDKEFDLEGTEDAEKFDELDLSTVTDRYIYKFFPEKQGLDTYFESPGSYYLIKEIPIKEIIDNETAGISEDEVAITIENLERIESKVALPIDSFTHHKLFSDVVYEYNSRLHYGNITTRLNDGLNLFLANSVWVSEPFKLFYDGITTIYNYVYDSEVNPYDADYDIYMFVEIKTNDGLKKVLKKCDFIATYTNLALPSDYFILLNTILSYPDKRAISLQFLGYTKNEVEPKYYEISTKYDLISHPTFNFAYYLPDFVRTESTYNSYIKVRNFRTKAIKLLSQANLELQNEVTVSVSQYLTDSNRVQASEIDNILYFPSKNSYRIGSLTNEVKALISQSTPVSEGQYGYFPLIVFTADGIYILEQGDIVGDEFVLYKSIQPLSLHVVNNANSVTAINQGVLFSSDKGLMILSGRDVIEISEPVEGTPNTLMTTETNYVNAIDGTDNVVTLDAAISTANFKSFIEEAIICYDIVNDEIVISSLYRIPYQYSYIFSLKTKMWFKTNQYWDTFIRVKTDVYLKKDDGFYSLNQELNILSPSTQTDVLIKTRPFKFADFALKSIERLVARLQGEQLTAGKKFAFYVYGSLDGVNWQLINGLRGNVTDINTQDLLIRRMRTTAKYFIIVFAAQLKTGTIAGFEADIIPKYANKIR